MFSVWFGCRTCRRSFLKLDDWFEHKEKEVHPFVESGIQSKEQTVSLSENLSDLGVTKKSSQAQHNPFVHVRRLSRQQIENSSVSNKISHAKYTEKASSSSTLPTAKRSENNAPDFFQFQCKLCLDKCNSDSALAVHLNTCILSHQHRHRFCVPCNTKFHQNSNLKRHISTCHVAKEKKAKLNKSSNKQIIKVQHKSGLSSHALTAAKKQTQMGSLYLAPEQRFICHYSHCGKRFQLSHHLTRHLTTHSDEKPLKCPYPNCEKSFKTKDSVRQHMKLVHKGSPGSFKSSPKNCEKTFKESHALQWHTQLTHSARVQFKCPERSCSKTFNHRGSLWYHVQTHSDLQPFKCPKADCLKSFKLKRLCQRHLMSHSDARPFPCFHRNCGKAFNFRDKLNRHLKSASHFTSPSLLRPKLQRPEISTFEIKTEKNPSSQDTHPLAVNMLFICKNVGCGKQFGDRSNLRRHRRRTVHSCKKPFSCPVSTCA